MFVDTLAISFQLSYFHFNRGLSLRVVLKIDILSDDTIRQFIDNAVERCVQLRSNLCSAVEIDSRRRYCRSATLESARLAMASNSVTMNGRK
jgi:hypothetical protein